MNLSNTSHYMDSDEYLHELNLTFTALILPAIIVLAVFMVIGIIGNGLVLYVYCRRMKTGTITRYIQGLAIFDLLSCSLAIPGEIIDMTNNYTFGSNPLCQIVRTVNLFCTMVSGSILIVVAIDRYKRICYPLGKQISPKSALYIMTVCSALAIVLALPTAVIFGAMTVPTNISYIKGSDCSVSDNFKNTTIPLLYNGLQMFLFLVGAIILIVLYSIVARRIFQHAQGRQRRRSGEIQNRKRKIWSFSYCSSPSLTPNSPPDSSEELKVKNTRSCDDNKTKSSFDFNFKEEIHKHVLLQSAKNIICHRSNSDKDLFLNKAYYSSVKPKVYSLDDVNTERPISCQTTLLIKPTIRLTLVDQVECLRRQSLPKHFRIEDDHNINWVFKDFSPPSTPIEELNNPNRWLLTGSSEQPTQHNPTIDAKLESRKNPYESQDVQLSSVQQSKVDQNSPETETLPTKTINSKTRKCHSQNSKKLLPNRRWSMRLSIKSLGDIKKLSINSDSAGTRRTTLMLFVITLIYIFSFLPHLLLMIFKTLNIDWLSQYGDTGVMLHNLLIRSYFINSASNPIIYSFFSKNFFSECKYILKKTCRQRT
ncbi:prostaglandin E2 receptor EP4 subtype-like isoform X1 [Biomphalaria glabrata]|uniref:Prostaglandin E2 receptor EP4 subtype-like isoform X1 n=3 Tax=Biomphalaria glabrata TaxID=6526 RepID=A0A9W3B9J7_BIOGL|nr:prostaglandin E2 receptor EP4 subtype-like isoform X1 [Biomphalaria glabrata]